MRSAILVLAAAAAAIGSAAALGAPGNKNTGEWHFVCNNQSSFYALRSNSSGTSFHIEGTNTNFLIKTFTNTDTDETFYNKGFDNNQNSGELITCTTQSPVSPYYHYSMTGVITPNNG